MLRVYMMYKADSEAFPDEVPGRWVAESTWPSPRIESSNLYFDAGGRLSPKPNSRDHVKYVGDKIVGLTKPQWVYGRPTEFEQSPDDRNSLLFDSAPLEHDLEILGYPIAKIRVSADVPVAQIRGPPDGGDAGGKILAGDLQRAQSDSPQTRWSNPPP